MRRLIMAAALVAVLGGVTWLLASGWSYYTTPLIERPRHPDYWALKPGGTRGRAYGIAGAALMTMMLVYSLRKRTRAFRRLGMLSDWLRFHILCGILGPLLILLHTSFKFGGLVSISFWSMVAVAASGVLGRYLYLQIPRARTGDALSLEEVEAQDRELRRELRDGLGLRSGELERLEAIADQGARNGSLLLLLLRLPLDGLRLRLQLRGFVRSLGPIPLGTRQRLLSVARRKAILGRRLALWARLQRLFHYWHVLHKPFAIIMYLFMAIHIAVVSLTGYGW